MLSVNKYPKSYIDECRARIDQQLNAYKILTTTAINKAGKDDKPIQAAIASFDLPFFNNLVVLLDAFFIHRTRALEKKDGNPINEVRVIAHSILKNKGKMAADNTIKLNPAHSILKFNVGDTIRLDEAAFIKLSKAFLAEIEKKFS